MTQAGLDPVAKGDPETDDNAPVVRFTVKAYTPEFALAAKTRVPLVLAATDTIPLATDSGEPDTADNDPPEPTAYSDIVPAALLAT